MPERQRFDRITFDPRLTVATVLDQLAAGASVDEILADYPYLEREDISQALAYAASLAREDAVAA